MPIPTGSRDGGAIVKIRPDRLPQRPNIHWLGQQPMPWPQLVAYWGRLLLPFA
jgi:hypothetical protein